MFLWAERQSKEWVYVCVAGMITLVVDLVALAWVGMWMGLRNRHANRAAAGAVLRIMVLPWIVWGLALTLLAVMSLRFASNAPRWVDGEFFYILWLVISVFIAVGFGLSARTRLLNDFRLVATQRYDQKSQLVLPVTPAIPAVAPTLQT